MCGIAGFFQPEGDFLSAAPLYRNILKKMNQVQKHRGPDDEDLCLFPHCGLSHVRLSIIDLKTGRQPMQVFSSHHPVTIVHNGEIYNMNEIRQGLMERGEHFSTTSDTEVLLRAYLCYGISFLSMLNGIFACAIYDRRSDELFLFRDHFGVKPLFYAMAKDGTLLFSSEIKGLFCYPSFSPVIDDNSLREVFGLGPAKSYGSGVFKDVLEVLPGHFLRVSKDVHEMKAYWKLESQEHTDSFSRTIERTSQLLTSSIQRQMLSDVPVCTFLSGGIDSSIVTAVCAGELKKQNQQLSTFSFDFVGNDHYFQSNAFQPSQDRPYVEKMVGHCNTRHHFLTCSNQDMLDNLFECVRARDLPCMADVESSMLYFCKQVVPHNKVVLTGECADEVFGGYPWFHKQECFDSPYFPWSMEPDFRSLLLKDEVAETLKLKDYIFQACQNTIKETPCLPGESFVEKRRREISYLNLRWFMATLLDRMDRTSMHCGLEARVPFADPDLVSYVFNIPWEMKTPDGLVKGLLRKSAEHLVPNGILYRPKCPYPKTYHPEYEARVKRLLEEILSDSSAPVMKYLDAEKVKKWLSTPLDYGKPFYGQLMAGPQLIAYLLQINYWLSLYR